MPSGPASSGDGIVCVRPHHLAVRGIIGADKATDAVLTTGDAHDDPVFVDHRRGGQAVADLGIRHLDVPHLLAGLLVERDEMGVKRTENDGVAIDGDAAIVGAAAEDVLAKLVLEVPEFLAGARVGGEDVIEGRRDVHDAVLDDRCGLEGTHNAGLEHPFDAQPADVLGVDLLARPEALLAEIAAVAQPVLALRAALRDVVRARGIRGSGDREADCGNAQACLEQHA